jgi:ATP-dependent RNA helicase DeaD
MNSTPMNSSSTATFQDFGLAPEIQQTLQASGFERPTEIQEKAIPLLLASDRIDFHGQAQTGTGKTLAFGLPLLHRINRAERRVQALVIVPTRELAVQICDSLRPLASAIGISLEAIYGGASMDLQLQKLRRGVHIVVGTPGRILDHLQRGSLNADHTKTLVLDEADIMLDMGFKDDIDLVLEELPESREIWLFSATVKSGIHTILKSHMKNHTSVRVNPGDVATTTTKHFYCIATPPTRLAALCRFIECHPDFYGFIFCQTKILAAQIAEQLLVRGYRVGALHGDLSQAQRNIIIKQFKAKDRDIVVATDVAARGIDVKGLSHVINYSCPDDQESYLHRSGRTGRAGLEGIAITFINKHEMRSIKDMQRKFNIEIEPINVPDHGAMMNVRINSINSYLTKLNERPANATCTEVVSALSDEHCRKALSHVLYDMFIKQVDDKEQFVNTPSLSQDSGNSRHNGNNPNIAEISINVGSDDNVQREDIIAVLESKNIALDSIAKIRILKRCTFIHTSPDQLSTYIQALQGTTLGGRTVRATQVQAMGGERSNDRGDRGGGRRRYEYSRSGGDRHERSNNNNNGNERYERSGNDRYERGGYDRSDRSEGGFHKRGGFSHKKDSGSFKKRDNRYGANKPELYQADSGKNHDRGHTL